MGKNNGARGPGAGLSRRDLLRLTGGAVAGTVLGCSNGPLPYLNGDGAVVPFPDAGTDTAPASPDLPDLLRPDQHIDAAGVEKEPGPVFFVHFTDIHIGSGKLALPALNFGLASVLPSFPSIPVLATGDLVETGNNAQQWASYQKAIDGHGLNADDFIETPGNHDALLDGQLDNYIKYTLAGRNGHGKYGLYHRVHEGRRIRIVALNTCSGGNPIKDSTGYLQQSQIDTLIQQINLDPNPVHATIVLGHHPPGTLLGLGLLGTDKLLSKLLSHTSAAAYLHGHLHMHLTGWEGKTLMAQAPSLGNPSSTFPTSKIPGFNLFALDAGPVARPVFFSGDFQSLAVDWPVVMITRPADLDLGKNLISSAANPWADPLPRSSTGNLLHAGVFAPSPVVGARFRVDAQPWQPMTRVTDYFRAEFDTPDKDACVIEVQGQTSNGVCRSDSVKVGLA